MKTLALIGVGRWGKNLISTLEKIPEAKLKYLCAGTLVSLASYPARYEKVSPWQKLLKRKDIDAVLIATPPSTHARIATAFIEQNIPVFVEKPMVVSVSEAQKLQAIVKKSGKVFMVGYQYLFNDYVRYLKEEIEEGAFGKILSIKNEHVISPSRPDVDIFWDAGSHPLSVFQYLFEPKKLISAEGEIKHDSAFVKVEFENAPSLEIVASCFGEVKTRKVTLLGERGSAVIDETLPQNKLVITKNGKASCPEIDLKEPLRNEMGHFLNCLQTGSPPLTNVDFGCRITEWLEIISKKLNNNE